VVRFAFGNTLLYPGLDSDFDFGFDFDFVFLVLLLQLLQRPSLALLISPSNRGPKKKLLNHFLCCVKNLKYQVTSN